MKYLDKLSVNDYRAILNNAGCELNEDYSDIDVGFVNGVFYGDQNVILATKLQSGKTIFVNVTDYSMTIIKKGTSISWLDTDLSAAFVDHMSAKFGHNYDNDFNNFYNINIEM